jgi:hypothetical protein
MIIKVFLFLFFPTVPAIHFGFCGILGFNKILEGIMYEGRKEGKMKQQKYGRKERRKDETTEIWKDGKMKRWKDRQTERWEERKEERQIEKILLMVWTLDYVAISKFKLLK